MAITKEKKDEILKDLDDKFQKAVAVYFSDYRGLTVKDIGDLRVKLREEGVDYRIAKKTLMKLSVQNAKLPDIPDELLEGPVGAAFGYEDIIAAVRILHNFSKDNKNLKILGGLVEGKFISKAEAVELAILPSKDELLAKLVGSMKAPISGFHGVLAGLLRNFVYTLKAIEEQKPAEEAPKTEAKADDKPVDAPKDEAKIDDKPADAPVDEANTDEKPAETAESADEKEVKEELKEDPPKEEESKS